MEAMCSSETQADIHRITGVIFVKTEGSHRLGTQNPKLLVLVQVSQSIIL
jgi:hypothetical protein